MQIWLCLIFPSLSQRQITFLGPLEWRILFEPKDKVSCLEKLVFRSGVRFLFLFVLTDAILLKLDLQKRTSVLGNPPNEKLFVYKKWSTYQKIGDVLFFSYIKATIGQFDKTINPILHEGGTKCPPCGFSSVDFWWMRQMGSFFLTLFLSIFDRSWQIYFLEFFFKISRNLASKALSPPKFWRENQKNWNWTIFSSINHTFSCWI